MKQRIVIYLSLLTILFLMACSVISSQELESRPFYQQEILQRLGPPQQVGKSAYGGEVWVYSDEFTDDYYHFDATGRFRARTGQLNDSGRWLFK